ncbi:sugar ABC transporter ATP-binding protein [Mesorhizobium sp.]|uniref:sugar ABC transporter ATP-binding protein n=1 Tax=Mesorhizobium sp. TaxID=1871066 RepID=UPI000FE9CA73|nr:sugar ABC transporter ATP-binding protein [Mesorhizobium sp.]RWF79961.1 MAG: sugar ABC transporter ATP-binding protein [Mesorhizobium sp.]
MDDGVLSLEGVGKIFPGVVALSDVSLSIARGETHIVLGENGAGKSTLIKLLAGIYQPDSGTIAFNGQPYQPKTPHDAQLSGIRIVHQELNLLPYLSIAENLMLENLPRRAFGIVDRKALNRRAVALLKEVGLDVDPRTRVEALGVAQMQLVEIAKALSYDSKLLVLDEPTATLTPPEIGRLFAIIKRLKARGVTIIYISHRLHEVFEIGDRVTILRNGRLVATRDLHGLSVPDVVRMMIGRDIADEFGFDASIVPGKVALSVTNLKRSAVTPEISFNVRHGEILGVAGLVGSGRTEAMRALFGADPRLNRRAEAAAANDLIGQLRVKASSIEQAVRNLSGGNQQKVVLAKWLFRGTSTLILDEPTRGVDIGARREIYQLLWMLAAAQKGIIMVSSDLPELMGMCHRIIVFSKNKIVGEVPRAEFDQERILSLAYQEYVRP